MRCPRCVQAGTPHTVTMGMATVTLIASSPGYWNEKDQWVPPSPINTRTTTYHCSNGHTWQEEERVP